MKKQHWILLFLAVLAGDLAGILLQQELPERICKSLLMPVLILYFINRLRALLSPLKKWILLALLFSWAGDVLLLFQNRDELFFLAGLSAFLLAHVFYCVFFHQVRIREGIKSNPWLLLPVLVYYISLVSWLSPYLGDMKLPVRIYGMVISFMFLLALHMLYLPGKQTGRLFLAGAGLFVLSDSILAINKFYQPFEAAPVLIMLTYGLAQLLLTEGALRYLRPVQPITR